MKIFFCCRRPIDLGACFPNLLSLITAAVSHVHVFWIHPLPDWEVKYIHHGSHAIILLQKLYISDCCIFLSQLVFMDVYQQNVTDMKTKQLIRNFSAGSPSASSEYHLQLRQNNSCWMFVLISSD